MLIAHLSDLHLRDRGDVVALGRQLDRIAARAPDHLALTGDLLDRWRPALLDAVLDALASRGLLDGARTTILHGNHDLASSGGHPRRGLDLWRLATRFWDPPPLVAHRRRRFYAAIEARAPGVAGAAPFAKPLPQGFDLAVIDTVPLPWRPFRLEPPAVAVQHAVGCVRAHQLDWLAARPGPVVILMHHYPLDVPRFSWAPKRPLPRLRWTRVDVPMHIPEAGREHFWAAATGCDARLVLCGHVHRARLDHHGRIAVGLNGQSGADWAGRTIAWYDLSEDGVTMSMERGDRV